MALEWQVPLEAMKRETGRMSSREAALAGAAGAEETVVQDQVVPAAHRTGWYSWEPVLARTLRQALFMMREATSAKAE